MQLHMQGPERSAGIHWAPAAHGNLALEDAHEPHHLSRHTGLQP